MSDAPPRDLEYRHPQVVMRLARLGSLHQSRLSFMRVLMRRMAREEWVFTRPEFVINDQGVGHAVYTAQGPDRAYSLVAFAHDIPEDLRSDRVIATAWDTTFSLFDGIPDADDIIRLSQNVPYQEAGRVSEKELTLSRANRSVRLWQHFVDRLSQGEQPDVSKLEEVGYLMRTTAVYGSGKQGAADHEAIAGRAEMRAPFQAEMLTVYLVRTFVRDLVEHMARAKGGAKAVPLAPDIARRLGIGNSTGLGMAPFIIRHPVLFNNWMMAREAAIARVCALPLASEAALALFHDLFARSRLSVSRWRSLHPLQIEKIAALKQDVTDIEAYLAAGNLAGSMPWQRLMAWAEAALSAEGQEMLASLILEPYGAEIDGFAECMADVQENVPRIEGAMSVAQVRILILRCFSWARDIDWTARENCARVWYVSQEKLEPRLGERFDEPIAAYEQPLAPARDAALALDDLEGWPDDDPIAAFLMQHPEHRHTLRRVQISARAPYAEIQDNTIGADLLPVDMLRAKLSFFGATHFDPRSDRWVRICMYVGAPYPEDLRVENADLWVYPECAS